MYPDNKLLVTLVENCAVCACGAEPLIPKKNLTRFNVTVHCLDLNMSNWDSMSRDFAYEQPPSNC